MSTSLLDLDPLVIPLVKGSRILDVGCGFGHWGHLLMTHYRPDASDPALRAQVTGVDIHPGNVELCREGNVYADVVCADALDTLVGLGTASFDTVLAVDVLEHFESAKATSLLEQCARVAKQRVIVSTPNFPNLREGSDGLTGHNPWEHHVSCWSYRDFRRRGYEVRGVRHNLQGKLYRMRGMYRLFNRFPVLHEMLDLIASRHCRMAHTVLAWKDIAAPPEETSL